MKKKLDKILEGIACVIIFLMILVAVWQVASRYIFKSPSTFTEEFLRFSLIWLSMLGIAYVFGKSGHISIDFLKEKFSEKEKLIMNMLSQIVFTLFALIIMIAGGAEAVSISMYQIFPALRIPMGLVYMSLPVSGIFITFYGVLNLLEAKEEYKIYKALEGHRKEVKI